MTDAGEESGVDLGDRRQYGRVVVAVVAAATLVLAAAALPAVVGSGSVPALSLVPLERADAAGGAAGVAADAAGASGAADAAGAAGAAGGTAGAAGGATNLSGSGLGALSSAESTRIGGQTAPGGGETPLRNQSTAVHFVVESERPAYWRTGAYGAYTGQGFQRVDDTQPFDGTVEPGPLQGERVAYEVRLRQSATALPTVWRPARVDAPSGTRLAAGTSLSSPGVAAGTSYRGVSYAPAREPAVLRAAGRNYPDSVRERYLGLPDDPDTERVTAFTDELASDAATPYATAVAIEQWLEANREYSLSATHDPADGTVASEFLFEMSAGYCEYFAATMTAMLRTQGVPARYVVGYSTGQRTAPGEYTVRAMNAHAWVEVYFPEVGWVRFDPTPGQSRLATEQRSFADGTGQPATDYDPTETGSPGESFDPAQRDSDGESPVGATTASAGERSPPGGDVQTADGVGENRTGTAGDDTERETTGTDAGDTSVTGTPPAGGDRTATDTGRRPTGTPPEGGRTTATGDDPAAGDGTATGDSTATGDGTENGETSDGTTRDGETTTARGTATGDGTTRTDGETATGEGTPAGGETPTGDGEESDTTTGGESGADQTESSATDEATAQSTLRADLNRTAVPGATVSVTVTRGGEPVVARVAFNGASIGVTNASGVVVGTVPYAGELNVTVVPQTRGALADGGGTVGVVGTAPGNDTDGNSTTYTLDTRASVSVVGSVQSGRQVTLVATVSDVPVRGGAVSLDGSRAGRTDRRGRATVRLPTEPGTYTLAVQRGPVTGNRSVTIHRLNLTSELEWPLAVPFAPVAVTATRDGDPVDGATVRRAGATLGETGPGGRVTATLPVRDRATFVARAGGQRATTAVTGVLRTAVAVGVGLLAVVGVVAVGSRRLGVGPTAALRRLRQVTAGVARAVSHGVLWVADAADRAGDALVRLAGDLLARRLAVVELPARLARLLAAAAAGLAVAVVAALSRVRRSLGGSTSGPGDAASEERVDADDDQSLSSRRVVRAAWRQFVAGLSVRQSQTKTPGELARWAVDRDRLPAEPVRRLRDGYRAVEYGAADPSRHVDRVRAALAVLRGDAPDDETPRTDTDTRDESGGEP